VEYKYNVKMSKTFDYKKIVIMLQWFKDNGGG
jgi:hypothetical protein